ncbi:hypothetical protein BHE74_00005910 [Ensete ventricosum]|nr:hypothetical protein BHE74_00005910 [Ensete ventricosum]
MDRRRGNAGATDREEDDSGEQRQGGNIGATSEGGSGGQRQWATGVALVWRADSGSGGYSTGNEALEMKRKRRVWLEGNSGDNKDREEGMKMRATVVVAMCAIRRRCQQHWLWQRLIWKEDDSKGGAATLSPMEA